MQESYEEFKRSKNALVQPSGFEIDPGDLNPLLFDWQRDAVALKLLRGRGALLEECGLGKTPQQLEWANQVTRHTNKKALIACPLAVAHQTIREGEKFGIGVTYARDQREAESASTDIVITNYDIIKHFDPDYFGAVVLDESSILKNYTGKTKRLLMSMFQNTPYKLCCSATGAPNDKLEWGNHSQFLGVMDSDKMISRYFINDTMKAGGYRLKKSAKTDFYDWMTSWAVSASKPSDLGIQYSDDGFILPEMKYHIHRVNVDHTRAWDIVERGGKHKYNRRLFLDDSLSATQMWADKKATLTDRCDMAANKFYEFDNGLPSVFWCSTDDESKYLAQIFPNAVEVRGSHSLQSKIERLRAFSMGEVDMIITKPQIAGMGLNWQHAGNQFFVSVTYSFEQFYQALRRLWRFGQCNTVNTHLIVSETEGNILRAITRKQNDHSEMQAEMSLAQKRNGLFDDKSKAATVFQVKEDTFKGNGYTLHLGDAVDWSRRIESNTWKMSAFSQPFSNLYIYSDMPEDMGNTEDHEEFFKHFLFLVPQLGRIHQFDGVACAHIKDLPLYKNRDGAAGLYDFPGDTIEAFNNSEIPEGGRWVYIRKATIWKDPVIEMRRTNNHGLLWKNFSQRGEVTRQGMADYVLFFRKIAYMGKLAPRIEEPTEVQADVLRRCLDLWTQKGDSVTLPFNISDMQRLIGKSLAYNTHFSFWNLSLDAYTDEFIKNVFDKTVNGRLAAVRTKNLDLVGEDGVVYGIHDTEGEVIRRFDANGWTFHSRVALPDDYYIVVFRKWDGDFEDNQVQNKPVPPKMNLFNYDDSLKHNDYVGVNPPRQWNSQRDYSIQVWQRYASPIWFDFECFGGIKIEERHEKKRTVFFARPEIDNSNHWWDIDQTKVLNYRIARANEEEKHICPLQLDIIDKCIDEYSEPGDLVGDCFGGVGSTAYEAVLKGRRAETFELKPNYFKWQKHYLEEAEIIANSPNMFDTTRGK